MKTTRYHDWILALGATPAIAAPSAKHLYGWFYLTAVLTTATATDTSLVTHDAWYDDVRVQTAYNPADTATTPLAAHLRIEAYEGIIITDDLATTNANKVKLLAAATRPYLYATPEGQPWVSDFMGALSDPVAQFQLNFAAAAAAQHGLLRGQPKRVPGTVTVKLDGEQFRIKCAATGVGADLTMVIALRGALSPTGDGETARTRSFNPGGGACSEPSEFVNSDKEVALLRNGTMASYRIIPGYSVAI